MRRYLFLVLVLAACAGKSGSTSTSSEDGGSDAGVVVDSGRGDVVTTTDAPPEDVNVEDAGPDDVVDSSTPDADAETSADASDTAADADADAQADADAGADAGQDAGADTGPPPVCTTGQSRCSNYQYQTCNSTHDGWDWQQGVQSCCHDPRFSRAGNQVTDANTGTVWWYAGCKGGLGGCTSICGSVGGHLPTTAQQLGVLIGLPVNNIAVCDPAVDQTKFSTFFARFNYTADGCVDILKGETLVDCPAASTDKGSFCVITD